MNDKSFLIAISLMLGGTFLLIGLAVYHDLTVNVPTHQAWVNQCEQNGGVPSRYQVMHGKTTDTEYLCIKSESIVEVSPPSGVGNGN